MLMILEDPDLGRPLASTTRAAELVVQPVSYPDWSSWARPAPIGDSAGGRHGDREFLLGLDEDLRRIRSGLGYRLRNRILAYLATAAPLLERDRAADLAISQTVLPRLRTHHPLFLETADLLLRRLPPKQFPRCGRILEALRATDGHHDFFQLL
jgi:hypothetical protein